MVQELRGGNTRSAERSRAGTRRRSGTATRVDGESAPSPAANGAARAPRLPARRRRIRTVAVLAVVLYHAGVTSGGFVGVDMFFVLSGFLITGLLWRELQHSGRLSFASFYTRRARRLLPASVLVLLVTTFASVHWLPPLQAHDVTKDAEGGRAVRRELPVHRAEDRLSRGDRAVTVAALLVARCRGAVLPGVAAALVARRHAPRNAREWKRRTRPDIDKTPLAAIVASMAVLSFLLSLRLTHTSQPWAFFSLPTRAWELFAGALVAFALTQLRALPRAVAACIGWAGLAAVLWSIFRLNGTTPFPGTAALVPVLGTVGLLVAGSAAPKRGVSHALSREPLQRIGRISYSWYLWHWPVLVLAPVVAGHTLARWQNVFLAVASGFLARDHEPHRESVAILALLVVAAGAFAHGRAAHVSCARWRDRCRRRPAVVARFDAGGRAEAPSR